STGGLTVSAGRHCPSSGGPLWHQQTSLWRNRTNPGTASERLNERWPSHVGAKILPLSPTRAGHLPDWDALARSGWLGSVAVTLMGKPGSGLQCSRDSQRANRKWLLGWDGSAIARRCDSVWRSGEHGSRDGGWP